MNTIRALQVIAIGLCPLPGSWAQPFPKITPAEAGFAPDRLNRITQVLRDDATKGTIPGAVLMIVRHANVAYFESVAVLDTATKKPMTAAAVFRIYSITKPT